MSINEMEQVVLDAQYEFQTTRLSVSSVKFDSEGLQDYCKGAKNQIMVRFRVEIDITSRRRRAFQRPNRNTATFQVFDLLNNRYMKSHGKPFIYLYTWKCFDARPKL